MIFNVPGHIDLIRNGLLITATNPYIRKHHGGSLSTIVKTQTRRLNRGIYKVGKDYAVQRKRGVKQEQGIRIVMDRIWRETIARPLVMTKNPSFNIISEEDAWAEGGYTPEEFEKLFREINSNWNGIIRYGFEFHAIEARK